jgi:FtsZ-binding cell division protein ZapB
MHLLNISNKPLNWLAMTAGSILATLLLITGAEAAELAATATNASNSTLDRQSSGQLVARNKKRIKRKRVRVRSKARPTTTSTTPTTSPNDVTQTPPAPPAPTEVTPPPVPSVTQAEVEALRKSNQELRDELIKVDAKAAETDKKVEQLKNQQFSLNTKLQGSVIFGATGTVSGDFSRNTAFGNRARLELKTDLGGGTLTTRLQAANLGVSNQNPTTAGTTPTPEGNLSWTGETSNSVGIDALKYDFNLTPETQVAVIANAGAADDFADTINPYFDGDGNSGSISAFGNRPSIYYTIQGAGVGIRHKFSDSAEFSLGYLSNTANDPAAGGLGGGGYGALAQLTFKTGENSKVGLTYTRSFNSDFGTGSNNANLGGLSNNFGVQGSFQLAPQFALGGWAGYTQNEAAGGDRQIWNWAVTAAAPNLGGEGNLAGFLVGQAPRVTSSGNGTTDTKAGLHIEGFYQFKVSDNVSITPGLIYLSAPNQDANSTSAVIGALRTTFTF